MSDQLLISTASGSAHTALFKNKGNSILSLCVCACVSQAFDVQVRHFAVASLSDHLSAGGAVATVTGEGTWMGASSGAGLRAALFTLFTLLSSLQTHTGHREPK